MRNGVSDLRIGDVSCGIFGECPYQSMCVAPDRLECFIGLDSKGRDPLNSIQWDGRAPNLKCTFDLDKIDRADQLAVYMEKFNAQHSNTLLSAFCTKQISGPCPKGLESGCSKLLATNENGRVCRQWLSSLPRDTQDATMRDYCLRNDTNDCKCINRTTDPEYDRVKELNNYFTDNCWYKPCANSENIYLVPNRLSENTCAVNVCQQIIDAHAKGTIEISGNVNNINCNFAKGDIVPPSTPADTPKPPPTTPDKSVLVWLRSNWIVPAIAILFVAIFIVGKITV
jgi:Pox virus entry-fusion-complex G9/A16